MDKVLILGSGPSVMQAAAWPRAGFDDILVINNAWRVRPDWTHLIYPEDFPVERRPEHVRQDQAIITADDFVAAQNCFGGFVFAGGTMAFTASYWALHALRPKAIFYFGCDMVYPTASPSHFYGQGTADPLRPDVTLRSLEAKSCRFRAFAARAGCAVFNLSMQESRLCFPRLEMDRIEDPALAPSAFDHDAFGKAVSAERQAGYFVESGRYWTQQHLFDPNVIDAIDRLWRGMYHDA